MKEKKSPLISVIVPVYNIEEYLPQCIDSIIHQTYTKIQILLVDDGSTDASGSICDTYGRQDGRIEVIHKQNGGLVSARKAGVRLAKGEYVGFVDGDDWIDADTIDKLLEAGQDADIITYACCEEYETYQNVRENTVKEGLYRTEKKELYQRLIMNEYFFDFGILPHLCDKLIRRELLLANQMKVDDSISYGEDAVCTYPCFLDAESIFVTNMPLYHYRQRVGSIVKTTSMVKKETMKILGDLLKDKINRADCAKAQLQEQLHYYLWFVLLVKAYEQLTDYSTIVFPFVKLKNQMRVVVYGAGGFGKVVKNYCDNLDQTEVTAWVDSHYELYQKQGMDVMGIQQLAGYEFDCIIIAILNERIAESIKETLVEMGIPEEKIDWVKKDVLRTMPLPEWM